MVFDNMKPTDQSSNPEIPPLYVDAIDDPDIRLWSERRPISFRFAEWWAKHGPRGKGLVSRLVGKHLLTNARIVFRTRSKALLSVDPSNLDIYTYILSHDGIAAEKVIDAACYLLRPGKVFYDIGANAGIVSIEIAKRFGDNVTVFAFEPQEILARNIAVSVQLNDFRNMHVLRTLVGDKTGAASLFIPKSTAPASHASMRSRSSKAKTVTCRLETIDELVASGKISPPDVMKIDVEGAELEVLRGARQTLKTYRPSVIFETDGNADRFGYTRQDIIEFIRSQAAYNFRFPTSAGLIDAGDRLYDDQESDIVAVPAA
jgi:FkbM family methyltransferase